MRSGAPSRTPLAAPEVASHAPSPPFRAASAFQASVHFYTHLGEGPRTVDTMLDEEKLRSGITTFKALRVSGGDMVNPTWTVGRRRWAGN